MESIRALLESSGLPTADLDTSRPVLIVACEGSTIVGVGGFERFGSVGLLRSVVVSQACRGSGLGRLIVRGLEQRAQREGLTEFALLTQTARAFFEKEGYRVIERQRAPADVQTSAEFRLLCPQSACCMSKQLTQ